MNPFKKLASQTAIYGLPNMVGRLLNYFLVPLYTYRFSTAEFGVVTEFYAYVSFLIVLLTYGMETALFHFSEKEIDKEKVYGTALISLLISSALFAVLALLFSQNLATFLHYETKREYIVWFIFIIALDAFTAIPFAKLRQQNKAARFALLKSINIAVNIFFNIFFIVICPALLKSNPHTPLLAWYSGDIGVGYIFISNLLSSLITLLLLLPSIVQVQFKFDKQLWKKMLMYASPLIIAGLAGMVNETLDRILLKYMLPHDGNEMSQVGIYGACYKVSIIMTIFVQTFRYAAEPFFFSHARDKDASHIYANVMKYFIIACLGIFLVTMLFMDYIQYFVGKDFRVGLHIVPILLVANLFLGIFFNLSIWYKLAGKTKYGAYLTMLGALVTIIGNIILIPYFGYTGAAWATLLCYVIITVASYIIGQKNYPVAYPLRTIVGYFALTFLLYFTSLKLNLTDNKLKMTVNIILLLIFSGLVYTFENKNMRQLNQKKE